MIDLKKVVRHVGISELPDKSDSAVALGWLLGSLANEDHGAAAMALARLLAGQEPLHQGLREVLAAEIEKAAQGKSHILSLKSRKVRTDPNRDMFIAMKVWERYCDNLQRVPPYFIKDAIADVAREIGREDKIVRNAWEKWQRKLQLPLMEK
jgi:hypothetical protein